MHSDKKVVQKHDSSANDEPPESLSAQGAHEKEVGGNGQGGEPGNQGNPPHLGSSLLGKQTHTQSSQKPDTSSNSVTDPTQFL